MTVRSAVRSALALLSARDRRLLGLSMVIQVATSALDLLGILLIGLVGALSVTTIQSQPPPESVERVAAAVGLSNISDQALVMVFAGAAAVVLLTKSVLSSYLTRRVFMFLANRQALVSARLAKELLSRPLTFIEGRSSQETAFALIAGAGFATVGILGQLVILVTEIALLVVVGVAVLFLSPWVAVGAIAFFGLVAFVLQRAMGGWSARTGVAMAKADIASLNSVQEAIGAYREITVSHRRSLYIDRIQDLRWQAARVSADSQFISMFPKYMFEAALVVGGFALAAALFATQDSVAAVGTLALFLAAGSRVMPALLRFQAAALSLRGAAGAAAPTFQLAVDLGNTLGEIGTPSVAEEIRTHLRRNHSGFEGSIMLTNVTVCYPSSSRPALQGVSLSLADGEAVALVGRSGAGKSTMADLILGVISPQSGSVLIGGVEPEQSRTRWPGAMAYVPQSVMVANGTIRDNVALGLPQEAVDDELVWEALERAHLATFLRERNCGLGEWVGEGGVRLSGGQRQRLGIARALYTRPRLLVLDEATSSLDAETEQAITETIGELEGQVTTVVVAHRLSTVRNVQHLIYLEQGRVICQGTFEDVARDVPAFARQARLMGL